MTKETAKDTTEATFENSYPRYPLVVLALNLAGRIKAAKKPADQPDAAPVRRRQRTASPGQV